MGVEERVGIKDCVFGFKGCEGFRLFIVCIGVKFFVRKYFFIFVRGSFVWKGSGLRFRKIWV